MKDTFQTARVLTATAAISLASGVVGGCHQETQHSYVPTVQPAGGINTSNVLKAFESADPGLRFPVEDAVRIVQSGRYNDALPALRTLFANPTLTAEQKQALEALVKQIQTGAGPVGTR